VELSRVAGLTEFAVHRMSWNLSSVVQKLQDFYRTGRFKHGRSFYPFLTNLNQIPTARFFKICYALSSSLRTYLQINLVHEGKGKKGKVVHVLN
jgi:hypothetical protein